MTPAQALIAAVAVSLVLASCGQARAEDDRLPPLSRPLPENVEPILRHDAPLPPPPRPADLPALRQRQCPKGVIPLDAERLGCAYRWPA